MREEREGRGGARVLELPVGLRALDAEPDGQQRVVDDLLAALPAVEDPAPVVLQLVRRVDRHRHRLLGRLRRAPRPLSPPGAAAAAVAPGGVRYAAGSEARTVASIVASSCGSARQPLSVATLRFWRVPSHSRCTLLWRVERKG